jgi:hypothetical protein
MSQELSRLKTRATDPHFLQIVAEKPGSTLPLFRIKSASNHIKNRKHTSSFPVPKTGSTLPLLSGKAEVWRTKSGSFTS